MRRRIVPNWAHWRFKWKNGLAIIVTLTMFQSSPRSRYCWTSEERLCCAQCRLRAWKGCLKMYKALPCIRMVSCTSGTHLVATGYPNSRITEKRKKTCLTYDKWQTTCELANKIRRPSAVFGRDNLEKLRAWVPHKVNEQYGFWSALIILFDTRNKRSHWQIFAGDEKWHL